MEYEPSIEKGIMVTFHLKVHEYEKERLVAICDANLCGKSIIHNGVKLHIQERFYGMESYNEAEVLHEITKCTSLNAFGKKICELLLEHKLVHPASIMWIEDGDETVGHVILVR
ncbi:MAG: DUF424 family protein [Candidatus Kariarchaeaceae archaeon]